MRFLGAILLAAIGTLVRGADADTSGASPRNTVLSPAPSVTLLPTSARCGHRWVAVTPNFRIFWCGAEGELCAGGALRTVGGGLERDLAREGSLHGLDAAM